MIVVQVSHTRKADKSEQVPDDVFHIEDDDDREDREQLLALAAAARAIVNPEVERITIQRVIE